MNKNKICNDCKKDVGKDILYRFGKIIHPKTITYYKSKKGICGDCLDRREKKIKL